MSEPQKQANNGSIARQLRGRNALVTGGSLGIGQAIVRLLAAYGANVAIQRLPALDAAQGYAGAAQELAALVAAHGGRACVIDADFGQPGGARDTVREAWQGIGPIDILFISASVQQREPFGAVSLENATHQFLVNYWSTVELLQEILPNMKARGFGRVVSIGSINQDRPSPDLAVYASLKAAQHNLITNLAKQHIADGITLNTVSPGLIATPRNDWRRQDQAAWGQFQADANPLGRAGQPQEVAQVAVNLVLDNTGFITGVNIGIDGGANL
jgi:NAD(P)-dependent dehydrogenase (short-subunit alcohol dehydrogenase family)